MTNVTISKTGPSPFDTKVTLEDGTELSVSSVQIQINPDGAVAMLEFPRFVLEETDVLALIGPKTLAELADIHDMVLMPRSAVAFDAEDDLPDFLSPPTPMSEIGNTFGSRSNDDIPEGLTYTDLATGKEVAVSYEVDLKSGCAHYTKAK